MHVSYSLMRDLAITTRIFILLYPGKGAPVVLKIFIWIRVHRVKYIVSISKPKNELKASKLSNKRNDV